VALATCLGAANASAFCRTTTCDINDPTENCSIDANGCATTGKPLAWREGCLSFVVQKDGSVKRGVTYQAFDAIAKTAFKQWVSAACPGGTPSFQIYDLDDRFGPVTCGEPEYNKEASNANVLMFRDDKWPYTDETSTLALTTVSFEVQTGRILDADIEVNSAVIDITTSDQRPVADLQSIITHESGHFLGLAHSNDVTATMFARYAPGDLSFRSLRADDQNAICTAYPPGRQTDACTIGVPVRGFSQFCGGINPIIPDPTIHHDSPGSCATRSVSSSSPFGITALSALSALLGVSFVRRIRRRTR
jgi:hypothetical protein